MSKIEPEAHPLICEQRVDVLIDEPRHIGQNKDMVVIPDWAIIEEIQEWAVIDESVQQTPVSPNEPV